ncbi:restriction endonuclease subunit S [Corynebacterium pseudogenitalium]|uniref:restriction endonuclease subunit S n=1 Tax=Corynebacterium pseudogenitalium TaxID=38303 RepID=UPI00210AACB2|nr:restriction endonuclease subunit S [Corynebacterium pseudogenitalium]MCQ4608275.1 restriction endonuclease subunit S [Corynebacterium pseudogenitalium]
MVKLGDVAEVVTKKVPGENLDPATPYFGLEHLKTGGGILGNSRADAFSLKGGKPVFESGDILFGRLRPNLRKAAIASAPGTCSGDITILRMINGDDTHYLLHFLLSGFAFAQINRHINGINLPRINNRDLLEIKVPLPPLEEQQRIATILGTVEEAIRAEEQSISKLETLVKNLAPETNRTVPIGEYVERIVSGKSLKEHSTPGGPRVLKISSTTSGYFKPEESKPLDPSYEPPEHHRVQEGDLLVSRANTTELVGASAIVDQPYENLLLPDKLWRLVTKDSVDPFFLWACLQHPLTRNAISKASSGSGGSMKNISQTDFLSVEIPDVDAALQTTVGNQVRTAFHQRALRSSKLTLLRELYTSLSSRAFSREL